MRERARRSVALLACLLLLSVAPAAQAEESAGAAAGWGMLSGLCSVLYAPVKVLYAVGGFVIGGFAFALSAGDKDTWNAVVTPAVRGDYVVTPANLRGEDSLEFVGRAPEPTYGASDYGSDSSSSSDSSSTDY